MKSACFTTHTSRDNTYSPRVHPETSLSCGFRPPPTVLVFPLTVLRGTLHQLHHASLVLLLLHLQHLQFSLFILCTPPLKYSLFSCYTKTGTLTNKKQTDIYCCPYLQPFLYRIRFLSAQFCYFTILYCNTTHATYITWDIQPWVRFSVMSLHIQNGYFSRAQSCKVCFLQSPEFTHFSLLVPQLKGSPGDPPPPCNAPLDGGGGTDKNCIPISKYYYSPATVHTVATSIIHHSCTIHPIHSQKKDP